MATDLIRYDLLVQDALRSVVRKVLIEAGRDGLPGEHHFCVTFRTHAPGVRLSARVRERHPEEMTIILQHQFWDLVVSDQGFEVGLSFGNIPERLIVPFEAVTGFWDPSVQFGLKFEIQDATPEDSANDSAPIALAPPAKSPGKSGSKIAARVHEGEAPSAVEPISKNKTQKPAHASKPAIVSAPSEPAADAPAKVVSIDAFRKKT
ncbi:MAG TPA: ClpXP protease specificity-enhancing factor SspB [Beijerinckiaceae bacterium]|nr:ClpXP protease specificity-enhancing factor SspB [Beijerinckiaceae bacterium]